MNRAATHMNAGFSVFCMLPKNRLVCAPMHVHSKRPELKSSYFSHVFTKGASAQRLDHATDTELVATIDTLITSADDRLWLGYVQCRAKDIRQINVDEKSE